MTVGSLFAGIGGFDLGLERAGFTVLWQCEIDPFCRKVLAKHWPNVRRYEDVREIHGRAFCTTGDVCLRCVEPVDLLCGGFPCQDISTAGRGAGIDGERSGLWREYARLIRELRPRYVFVENVSALLARGLGRVLGDLAACGYDAEWDCLPASAFGAPHRRDRLWLVAYATGGRRQRRWSDGEQADSGRSFGLFTRPGKDVANTTGERPQGRCVTYSGSNAPSFGRQSEFTGSLTGQYAWLTEPDVGRVAHGIPARVDRLRGLGNAIVPQIAEWIGRRILEAAA